MPRCMTAWQCIGCGRIAGTQPCVGICRDCRAGFVYAAAHDEVVTELAGKNREIEELLRVVRRMAGTHPCEGGWARTDLALQQRARRLLEWLAAGGAAVFSAGAD